MTVAALQEGRTTPLGAVARDGGVNFAVFSEHADAIDLCLFDAQGETEHARLRLFGPTDGVFHGFLPGAQPGLVYGLRGSGPYEPHAGHRFNPNKLLLDPYAREIVGAYAWRPEHFGYQVDHPQGSHSFDVRDNAAWALKARVAPPPSRAAGWLNAPRHRRSDLLLYEVHVRGFSQRLPGIPEELRGTYAALAHPAAIGHFRSLGVTTLSLLPIQYWLDEQHLVERGLRNYWGYNTLGFFCPDPRLAAASDPSAITQEFRAMVHTLHEHGLEVVLDVVYNHTAEGGERGPTLSMRGLDHASWYRLDAADKSRCENWTGCGNTLQAHHPRITQFVLDSLRYWAYEMGVDGFRFDLAPILGRTARDFDANAPFFVAMRQDPVLSQVHWISEPWDGGPSGYQVGRFPGRFMDWNDRFRDAARGYWLGRGVDRGEIAQRLTASSDLFQHDGRLPSASVNFLCVHDGFTLRDVVSYAGKHNHANGEDNRDGRDGELCDACGVEGPTQNLEVNCLRSRLQRALLATLFVAQGTPMLGAGDEIGRTQHGNNNAYCQDNVLTWLDWDAVDGELLAFVRSLSAARQRHAALRWDAWFGGVASGSAQRVTRLWLRPDGREMQTHDWHDPHQRALGCELRWTDPTFVTSEPAAASQRLLLLLNPHRQPVAFALPPGTWQLELDSALEIPVGTVLQGAIHLPCHAVLILHLATALYRSEIS